MGRMTILIAAACLLAPLPAWAGSDASPDYASLVRDILIVRQCGLSDELVEAGFRVEVDSLVAAGRVIGLMPAALAVVIAGGVVTAARRLIRVARALGSNAP